MKSALPIMIAASILLTGCDELEVEETHNFGDEMYENNYTLVNTTDLEVDYYMANTDLFGDAQEVKDSQYYVDTLASQSLPIDVTHAHNERSRISFYVVDHSDISNSATQMYQVEQNQPYHFVAWQNEEKLRLKHPLVNGVILFSRNFENSYQLKELVDSIKSVSETPLLVAVDNEGGRVQRFKSDGFTHLPAMAELYRYFASLTNAQSSERDKQSDSKKSYDQPSTKCLEAVNDIGYLMAFECLSHGIDLSFAPVMDIDQGSDVIGDRAFHESPDIAAELVNAFCWVT